jgi:hypothetical protein
MLAVDGNHLAITYPPPARTAAAADTDPVDPRPAVPAITAVSDVAAAVSAQPSAEVTESDPPTGVSSRKKTGAAAASTARADQSRRVSRQADDAPRAKRAPARSAVS